MKKIGPEIIQELIDQSNKSPRLRSHYNIHDSLEDDIQRLLICLQPGTYIRPHFHPEPDKKEMIVLIQGKCTCINFDAEGNVTDQTTLSHNTGTAVSEFPPSDYHSIYCHDEDTVIMEVKKGPYKPLPAECFASWAPEESDPEKIDYLNKLSEMISK
ncbi:MAG: WbuC family cupin fold metalloprotein [Lentisphaeraceae bacterium]|nr:WbuC family cupin fold metalloprotein [Lentisphaeraceae bacterium]